MAQWVRVDCDLFDHPKFWLLSDTLKDERAALWVLAKTWTWFTRLQPDGVIRGATRCRSFAAWLRRQSTLDDDITATSLVNALVDTGFLDGEPGDDHDWDELSVVDWDDYNGNAQDKREKARQRQERRRARARERDACVTTRDETRTDSVTTRDACVTTRDSHASTVRHDTLREQKPLKASDLDNDFEFWWVEYGKVGSKADARKLYGWWRERGATRDDLFFAAHGYRSHCEATDCKMKHARTFLAKDPNRWKEWAEGEEHGGMDVRGTRRLSDVIEAGIDIFGGDHERTPRLGPATHPQGGQAPRRSLPPGGVEAGE
jgi:hypothetical protein